MAEPSLAVQVAEARGDILVLEAAQERADARLRGHDDNLKEITSAIADLRVELASVSTRVALITGGTTGAVIAGVLGAIKFFGG